MIILDSTTKKLRAYTSATPTTDLTYYASYIDMSSLAISNIAASNGTFDETETDIVAAPGASTQRQIKYISLYNADSQIQTVTVVLDVSGTNTILCQVLLQPGYTLTYNNDGKWEIVNGAEVMDEGFLLSGVAAEPSTPSEDTMWFYAKKIGGRMMPKWIWTSAALANSASEGRTAAAMVWRGDMAGLGGWYYSCRWAISSSTALQQVAVGLWSATGATATTQVPSALTNCIFVGWDSADTELQVMHNDASGTCTKIPLGASFPSNNTTAVYEFMMFAPPNGSSVYYRVVRLDTGSVTEGEITTDLPASTTFLTRHEYMNNGGTAAAVVLEVSRIYIETDY